MEELEKTYLLKDVPTGLLESERKELIDIYVPASAEHCLLRIRKRGDAYEITKKEQVEEGDASRHLETTIPLTEVEYLALSSVDGKRIHKIRYYLERDGSNFEVDVFQGDLKGLVLVDIEFNSIEEKDAFAQPDFCLADVTQEKFIAGGMLCGKTYNDIERDLGRFGYKKIQM